MKRSVFNALAVLLALNLGFSLAGASQDRVGFGGGGFGRASFGKPEIPGVCKVKTNTSSAENPSRQAPFPEDRWRGRRSIDRLESFDSLKIELEDKPPKPSGPKPYAKIEGTVLDETGKPASEIEVHILGLDTSFEWPLCADSKGRYSLKDLDAGNYLACVLHRDKIGLCRNLNLRGGKTEKSEFHLAAFTETRLADLLKRLPAGSGLRPVTYRSLFSRIEGTVFDENGTPAAGIEVHITSARSPVEFSSSTDIRGRYFINTIPGELIGCVRQKGELGLCREFETRRGRVLISDFDLKYFQ